MGIDLLSDYLIDMAFRAGSGGKSFSAEDLMNESAILKNWKSTEIKKVKDRIAVRKENTSTES